MMEKTAASGSKQQGKGAGERRKSGLPAEMLVCIRRLLLYPLTKTFREEFRG
jgi:hypothetical protein